MAWSPRNSSQSTRRNQRGDGNQELLERQSRIVLGLGVFDGLVVVEVRVGSTAGLFIFRHHPEPRGDAEYRIGIVTGLVTDQQGPVLLGLVDDCLFGRPSLSEHRSVVAENHQFDLIAKAAQLCPILVSITAYSPQHFRGLCHAGDRTQTVTDAALMSSLQ